MYLFVELVRALVWASVAVMILGALIVAGVLLLALAAVGAVLYLVEAVWPSARV